MKDQGRGPRQSGRQAGRPASQRRQRPAEDRARRGTRGPLEPVPRGGRSWLPYGAIGAVAVLAVVAGVFIMSRPSGPERKEPPPVAGGGVVQQTTRPAAIDTAPEEVVPRGRRAKKEKAKPTAPAKRRTSYDAMREARRYETNRPKDVLGAIARYKAVAKEFPDTSEAGIAQMNVARLRSVAGLGPEPTAALVDVQARIPPDSVEFDGRKYRVYRQAATWGAAKILCESAGGHLATITSREENEFVTRLVRRAGASAWIGMSDQLAKDREERWAWVTGEDMTFAAWAPGMPNALGGVEQHVCLWKGADFAWDDKSGLGSTEKQHLYVCEWEAAALAKVEAEAAPSGQQPQAPEGTESAEPVPSVARPSTAAEPADMREQLASLLAEFDSLVERRDFAGAKRSAERSAAKAERNKKKAFAGALRSAARVAGLLESRLEAMRGAAEALVGQEVRLDTEKGPQKGKLVQVTEADLTLAIQMKSGKRVIGETRMPVPWTDLTARQEDRFAREWKPEGPEAAFARAVLAIGRADAAAVEREIDSAGKHLLAEHYQRKVDALSLARAETSALASWETIERWAARERMTIERAKSLSKLIASFEEKHGESGLAASKRGELARAKGLARRILVAAGDVPGAKEFAGRRYKLYRYPTRWAAAKLFCERLGGHLVTITSDEENGFVAGLAREVGASAWIGLKNEAPGAGLRWVTGEKADFGAWAGGKPGKAQPCALIRSERDYGWTGGLEADLFFFICEWEPPRHVVTPAPSASEAPFEPPPGHRKVTLYREDFEKGTGGWTGDAVKDGKGRGAVLRMQATPKNAWFAMQAGRNVPGGIAATLQTRISFKYRTEGDLALVQPQYWLVTPSDQKQNHNLVLPVSREWAHADFPAAWLKSNGPPIDLTKGFRAVNLNIYAGRVGQKGECFIDDFGIYDVVAGADAPD